MIFKVYQKHFNSNDKSVNWHWRLILIDCEKLLKNMMLENENKFMITACISSINRRIFRFFILGKLNEFKNLSWF